MSDSDPETIPPDSCSEDEDSDRNLYRNFVLQTELREAIERIQASEVQGQDSDHFEDPDPDDELRIRAGLSYFSEHGAGLPPKNVHAVRRHLFWERHKIRNPAEKGDLWKHDDDTSLLDVVRAQIMEELFRKVYHSKVQSVPPLDRPQFFMDTQKEISEMSSEDLWKNLGYSADWHRISKRMMVRGYPHSAKECYLRYLHKLHPLLKKGRFTKAEDVALLQLSSRYEGFDWDQISQHMPTGRTAWRCFERYQKSLNNGIVKEGWQQHELDHLRKTALELGYFPDMVGKKIQFDGGQPPWSWQEL